MAENEKLNILRLMDLFLEQTDREHIMTAEAIYSTLETDYDIVCSKLQVHHGEKIKGPDHKDDGTFRVSVLVSVSPQFFGWITALGPGVRIEGPTDVREEYLNALKQAMGLYQEEP